MIDLSNITKLYYSIGEVADMFGVSKSLVRYWETEFSFLNPKKNKKGDRRFTKQNIEQLHIIHTLVKERGFTLEGAKHEIKENKQKLRSKEELLNQLQMMKKSLLEWRKRLDE